MITADVNDYRELARRRLPRFLFDYIDGGAFAETTLRRNVSDLQAINVRQRVLTGVDEVRLGSSFFGVPSAMPLALAPVGMAGMNARRGEVQAARAAHAAGVPFCLSTVSTCTIEEVHRGSGAPVWFQLYMIRDRGFLREMLVRAREAGSSVLVFTVDMPVPSVRYRDRRSGLSGPTGPKKAIHQALQAIVKPEWLIDVGLLGRPHSLGHAASVLGENAGIDAFWSWMGDNFDASVTWRDLEIIRAQWPGTLIIKGILNRDDARASADLGADGIVVSNHGGRQLDGATSTIKALPPIAEAVGDRLTVMMDGGVRTGLDVVRALASGADAALIGRAWAYGLGARGEAGVRDVLEILATEMRVAMALMGCASLAELKGRSVID
jgi:L-lactate dehydrogenase (cytochrome)